MDAPSSIREHPDAPDLRPGITRLRGEREGRAGRGPRSAERRSRERGTAGLHRLVAGTLATATGPAYWVDAGNEAAPLSLFRAAADHLSLERLRIARAFTAYQHHSLVERLVGRVDRETALVVASSLPALYADDDLLAGEGAALFRESVKRLLRLRRRFDVPVLVTHAPADDGGFAGLLAACADREVEVVETDHGVRFVGEDARTTAYADPAWPTVQATLDAFAEAVPAAGPGRPPESPVEPSTRRPGERRVEV